MAISVRPVGGALGAEILGVDLRLPLDDATFAAVLAAWREHEVVFFRDQDITPEQHVAFSRRFGELEHHVRQDRCRPGYPEIFVVSNVLENGRPIGSQDAGLFWHSDLCYMREPSQGSIFYAREVPHDPEGRPLGDTVFASMAAAYEALPAQTRRRIEGLRAVNSYAHGYYRERNAGPRPPLTEEQRRRTPDVAHPVVRTHPCTGRKGLFVNEGYVTRILDLPEEESAALLADLFEHCRQPRFMYRHRWRVGDLLIWDNCAVTHLAIADYRLPQRRRMERTTLKGSAPY